MDIALVTTWNVPCGIATYSAFLEKALTDAGHTVTILSEMDMEQPLACKGTVTCWSRGKSLRPLVQAVLSSKTKPDVIHFQHEYGLFPNTKEFIKTIRELSKAGIPTVVTLHTVDENATWVSKLPLKTKVIVHTTAGLASIPDGSNFCVPHGCINTEFADPSLERLFLVPGFINESKDTIGVVRAYIEEQPPGTKMIVAGMCRDTNYREKLERLVDFSGADVELHFKYFSDKEMLNLFSRATTIILGRSKKTPYSASGQLALAFGSRRPVLAQDTNIHKDHGGGALLYSDYAELKRWMRKLLDPGQPLWIKLQMAGAAVAVDRRWSTIAFEHGLIYES